MIITEKNFDSGVAGGKAAQLFWLTQNGFNVPEWCVLSASELAKRWDENSQQIRFSEYDFTQIENWIIKQQGQGHQHFIVRSSLGEEDGGENSFAGLLKSYPNLINFESIKKAIQDCYRSANDERILAYRQHRNIKAQVASMAVIIQVMIDAKKSGVLFSADPKDGSRRRMLISAAFGAGQGVVDGRATCDEFEVDSQSLEFKSHIFKKDLRLSFAEEGLHEVAVTADDSEKPVLESAEIYELVSQAKKIVSLSGQHRDIEWVSSGERFYFLQSRPITSLGKDTSSSQRYVFDNSNIQESFNGLTLPLTYSYAVEAYHRVYRQLMFTMGFDEKDAAAHDRRHRQMLGLIRGRVYYNINSWYQGLLFLPSFGRNKEDMERMMGLESPVDFVVDQKLSRKEKLRRIPFFAGLLVRLSWAFYRIDKIASDFRADFVKSYNEFRPDDLQWLTAQDIFTKYSKIKENLYEIWGAPVLNDFYVMMMSGKVTRSLKKVSLEGQVSGLLAGEDLESFRPTKMLLEVADKIRIHSDLKIILADGSEDKFFDEIRKHEDIYRLIETYIELYGDRVAGELKLETISLRQDKGFLVRLLRSYVADDSLNLQKFENRQRALRQETETLVFSTIREKVGSISLFRFKSHLKKFRKGVAYRESMRLDRTRSFGLARTVFNLLGVKLFEQGWLETPRDIFYLTVSEIDGFLFGQAYFDTPASLVESRKKQYEIWENQKLPGQISVTLPLKIDEQAGSKKVAAGDNEKALKGLGCYPGQITAEVIVLADPNTNICLKGKILVAERTDPGWTPLFAQIAGLIVEKGSQLSHSAVIAREMGIPTAVNIANVTEILKTGDRVFLDGQSGQVFILEKEIAN